MIFAVLTLIAGIALSLKRPIEKKFKNRTFSFISLMYIGACIIIGIVSSIFESKIVGLLALVSIIIVLNYMITRFGLKPEQYKKIKNIMEKTSIMFFSVFRTKN